MAEQYIYAVARVRGKELALLNGSFMETLMAAKDYGETLRLLADKGWAAEAGETPEDILKREREKTWSFISELVEDMSIFDVFLYANDYHNLKAAIKDAVTSSDHDGAYISKEQCTFDPAPLKQALRDNQYDVLPEYMREVARQAMEILLHTGDGQLTDVIVDAAALHRIYEASKKTGNDILKLYGELTVASANIKTAIRANRTGKDADFLKRALCPCDSLDVARLAAAAAESMEEIFAYLERTEYRAAVEEIKKSSSAFERWCDNKVIESMRPQIHNPFTLGPLAAYILARENEIKTVRIILSGKRNSLPEDVIRERVREMYV